LFNKDIITEDLLSQAVRDKSYKTAPHTCNRKAIN
jgi:hypothetical protein